MYSIHAIDIYTYIHIYSLYIFRHIHIHTCIDSICCSGIIWRNIGTSASFTRHPRPHVRFPTFEWPVGLPVPWRRLCLTPDWEAKIRDLTMKS